MHKEELDAILGRDTGRIERHLEALGFDAALPVVALGVCAARIDEAEPALLAVLGKAARGELLTSAEEQLFFRGLHILGGARRPRAFAPLMQFLRRPPHEVDSLIGDATTITLPRIVAGAFDGDATSLFAAIEDPELGEFVRSALFGAATFLAWDKQIDRTLMTDFLQRFFESRRAPPCDHLWNKWAEAIALLGEHELADRVREAFRTKLVDPGYMHVRHFEQMLAEADRSPDSAERFEREHLGYVEDIQVALEQFTSAYDEGMGETESSAAFAWPEFPAKPHVNPLRHVGRNDPCPCGSGRKFKKCCLT